MSEEKPLSKEAQFELQTKEKALENYNRELREIGLQKSELEHFIDLRKKQRDLQVANMKIATSGNKYRPVTFNWEFEKDEEYIENTKIINQVQQDLAQMEFDRAMVQNNKILENLNEQIKSIEDSKKGVEHAMEMLKKGG